MFKSIIYLTVAFVSLALANEPISVTISGPSKICTSDTVTFRATTEGATAAQYSWSTNGGSGEPHGSTYTLTAPSTAANITVQCIVTSGGNDPQSDTDTFGVAVVVPQITVSRRSYKIEDFENNEPIPGLDILNDQGTAYIHRNGLQLDSEKFYLSINITPSDIQVQQLELKTSDKDALHLYDRSSNQLTLLQNPKIYEGDECYISSFQYLQYLNVDGIICGTDYKVNLTINDNQKLSISYDVYGMGNCGNFIFPTSHIVYNKFLNKFPNLVDNEWGYIFNSSDSLYNSISFAIASPPMFDGHYFWVESSFSNNFGLTPGHQFRNKSGTMGTETSMDYFGNKNCMFELSDADAFFTSVLWGNHKKVNSIKKSNIIYYQGFYAAKKSNHTDGFYPLWNIFQSKYDIHEIIIHRAEQLIGTSYTCITNFYK